MRSKFLGVLFILGGVLASFAKLPISSAIIAPIGGFIFGIACMFFTSVYSGTVWGIKIKSPAYAVFYILFGILGVIIGGFSVIHCGLSAFVGLLSGELIESVISIVSFVATLIIGSKLALKFLESATAKATHAMVLSNIDMFQEIDANMNDATCFVVGFEGVALFSSTNYCYAVYRYENYRLGELTDPSEVAMVGSYFVQKYHDKFKFKVDMEVIPGEPGQTVVAVGAGGVSVGRISGTPDKRIFRSYIFTKRK